MARHTLVEERPTLTRDQWIYLAGILDGEGCVGVFSRGGRKDWMRPHVQITNTSLELLAWIRRVCPLGTIHPRRETRANRKDSWCWRLACDQALWLLKGVAPWVVVKRAQVEAVLTLAAVEEGNLVCGRIAPEVRAARVVCFDTIARLNYRARRKVA